VRDTLNLNGIPAAMLSGDVPQISRLKVLKRYMSGEIKVLVATDVASRGLHVEDISHVFNYDIPQDPQDYVHRIGRTARAGASGKAITLACEDYVFTLPEIEDYIGQPIPTDDLYDDDFAEYKKPPRAKRPPQKRHGGSRGGPGGRGGRSGGGRKPAGRGRSSGRGGRR
jgi:ATP-dependent RNA helicase RhlB